MDLALLALRLVVGLSALAVVIAVMSFGTSFARGRRSDHRSQVGPSQPSQA
jgi:hypothetical protein